jgi:hypothetical protein
MSECNVIFSHHGELIPEQTKPVIVDLDEMIRNVKKYKRKRKLRSFILNHNTKFSVMFLSLHVTLYYYL